MTTSIDARTLAPWSKLAATGSTLFMLFGCSPLDIRPDTGAQMSRIAVPAAWSEADTMPGSERLVLSTWWRQFDDSLLDQLIAEAMTGAPDLRSAQARLRQSRASRDLAVAGLYPSVGVSLSANRSRSGVTTGATTGGAAQTLYAAGFDASWESSIFGGLKDAAAGAEADAAAMAASLDATKVSLAAEVALNYVALRVGQRRLAVAHDHAASQAEMLRIAEWREEAGLVSRLDVEQARTNLEQTNASIPALESSRAEAEHRLALLTGQTPGSLREQLRETRPLPRAPNQVAVGIPANALRQRPDVRAAEFALQAEISRTAQREADRYPSLNLNGSWGWQAFAASGLGDSANLVRSLAGSLAASLWDGGRIRSRIAVQDSIQEQALIAYEKCILTALEDVENALSRYATSRQRIEARRRAATTAGNAAALARTLYEAGVTDFQKVLDAERTRLGAEDELAIAEADVLNAVIRLYKALGGGWHADTPTPTATP